MLECSDSLLLVSTPVCLSLHLAAVHTFFYDRLSVSWFVTCDTLVVHGYSGHHKNYYYITLKEPSGVDTQGV